MVESEQLLGYLKRVSGELYETRERLRRFEAAEREPVAIVGLGCRLPGRVESPEAFWKLLAEGTDAISGIPGDRGWDGIARGEGFELDPDATASRGGFVHAASHFDAGFFGISPREALAMDPQQRILLETSWEALERTGIDPASLRASSTGVFVGGTFSGYPAEAAPGAGIYQLTGTAPSVISGRIAYCLGLEGPALTIDTACSSSLVALHLAAQALRAGECTLALAGGVTVMAVPAAFSETSRQQGLADDGRCKAFGAGADGTGWAEGAAILVLEKLSDARRNGHTVLALVRGSAVNQDGASNGLTAPNGPSQQRVIRAALADARLAASDVDAVEAHGTGTVLGDPIEAHALLATYGQDRPEDRPLWLGSVKSNFGHAQAAAGAAGVMKMVLALQNGVLPRTLHADEPSPHIHWEEGAVRLLTEARPWPVDGRPRRAAVSAFGVSGTNAHIILEQAPAEDAPNDADSAADTGLRVLTGDTTAWLVSSRTDAGLVAQAERLTAHLAEHPELDPADVAWSLATTRSAFERRAVVLGRTQDELLAGISAIAAGEPAAGLVSGTVPAGEESRPVVFVFPGQGGQWLGMGQELLASSPVFAARLAQCADALASFVDWDLEDVLTSGRELTRLDVLHPALWAIMVSLAAVWEAAGVAPDAVIGHSQGEIAAAVVAGVLSLEDGARVVARRGRAMAAGMAGCGGVLSLAASLEVVESRIAGDERLAVATINGPEAVTVSGPVDALQALAAECERAGVRARFVPMDYAPHGPQVEAIRDEVLSTLTDVSPSPAVIPMVSGMTADYLDGATADAEYWYASLRETVRFSAGIERLRADGYGIFIEVSPHPVLTNTIAAESVAIGTLRRDDGGPARLLASFAEVHVHGVPVDWTTVLPEARRVPLPTYAFQRQHFWPTAVAGVADVASAGLGSIEHPLLGAVIELADGDALVFTGRLSVSAQPWLAEPPAAAAVLVELAAVAGTRVGCTRIDELTVDAPLALTAIDLVPIQVSVSAADEDGLRKVEIFSRPSSAIGGKWTRHASGRLAPAQPPASEPTDAAFVEVALPEDLASEAAGFCLHPVLLNAAVHAIDPTVSASDVAVEWSGLSLYAVGASVLRVRLRKSESGALSLFAADAAGAPVLSVDAVTLRPVADTTGVPRDSLFSIDWVSVPIPAAASDSTSSWAMIGPDHLTPAAGINARTYSDLAELAAAIEAGEPTPDAVLTVLAQGQNGGQGTAARELTISALELAQQWLALDLPAQLVVVTQGAAAIESVEGVSDLAAAAARGLLRSAQTENPGRIVLVDLPATEITDDSLRVLTRAALDAAEPEIAIRGDRAYARRLSRPSAPAAAKEETANPGTVLVTGGTGKLAGLTAKHLADKLRARRLLLVSRSGPAAVGAAMLAADIATTGAPVTIVSCDVADRSALTSLLAAIPAAAPLTGIVHTAGVVDDGTIGSLTPARIASVLSPKTDAALILHELTKNLDLDLFILFSSAAATFGGAGQGNYAAGNAFLDALATHRRSQGLPAVSLAWGAWLASEGIGRNLSKDQLQRVTFGGAGELNAAEGLALLDLALARDEAVLMPVRVDVLGLRAHAARGGAIPAVLRGLVGPARLATASSTRQDPSASTAARTLRSRLTAASVVERGRILTDLVRTHVAAVLGYASADAVEVGRAFNDLGFDSLTAVDLRNRLATATGVRLPATLVFDYPTALVLAAHLQTELLGASTTDASRPGTTSTPIEAGEPIAIVGMACRFPGGIQDPEALWELLAAAGDAVTPLPLDRGWDIAGLYDPDPDKPGSFYATSGGFVHEAGDFDPGFFGISPREALTMDPQQRLLLETSWEALERAGIDPLGVRGSLTGVFAGGTTWGYGLFAADEFEGHLMTGGATSVLAGRLSYTLGLEGPAVTIDTACSSSLVAMHLAAQALRSGECSLALAGGVTIMALPSGLVGFSRQRGLAADGRCKAFSASADGMGMAEGAGMLLLERLSDAQRNGHSVLAVLRGSAVNQDGASNGLTAPNGPSQQRVIRAALANARLSAADVDVVEAHGTGTALGDPIEAQALLATYGQDRPEERPLWLGSVKSNLGHTQSAAGAAGVMKMILALQHEELPRSLYADQPAANIDWTAGEVQLLAEAQPWPANGHVRRAAVSSFGISGTNAHVIIEQAPPAAPNPKPLEQKTTPVVANGAVAWLVSGRTAAALARQADRLADHLTGQQNLDPADVAWSLAATRSVFEHRAVVVGRDRDELLAGLAAVAEGRASAGVSRGSVPSAGAAGSRVAFVFPGQGWQWIGMGQELAQASPAFAARLAECGSALAPYVDWSLHDVLAGAEGAPSLDRLDVIQPVLWAVMVSLTEFWRAAGVVPDAVLGHSQGEIAAAVVAGILSLEDGAKVVALRSKALLGISGRGAMLSIAEPAETVRARLADAGITEDRANIGLVNGPSSTVVAGDPEVLAELLAACESENVRARLVPMDYAAHSPQIEQVREDILRELADVRPRSARLPMVSAFTAGFLEGPEADAEHWYASLRGTVEFVRATEVLADAGYGVFIEVSGHPVLTTAVLDTLEARSPATPPIVTGTLRREDGGAERALASLAEVHVRGVAVDWAAVLPAGQRVDLPTYAFQHRRFWIESSMKQADAASPAEKRFWDAVEQGDAQALTDTLSVDSDLSFREVLPALASWRQRERGVTPAADWRYEICWPLLPEPRASELAGTWLLVTASAQRSLADAIAQAFFDAAGTSVVLIETAPGETERKALAARLDQHPATVAGVISLLALDEDRLPDTPVITAGLAATLGLLQALGDRGFAAPLWTLTRDAVATSSADQLGSPAQAPVWGLGLVAALEHSERWGGLIDLPAEVDKRVTDRLVRFLAEHRGGAEHSASSEDQVAIRADGVHGRRLVRVPRLRAAEPWTADGTVLVTGGTGAIGGRVADWLAVAGPGAPRIVLTSRSGPAAAGVAALAARLAEAGSAVEVVACDTARREPTAALFDRIDRTGPALAAVFHTAGTNQVAPLDMLTAAALAEVAEAKVAGARNLHELTVDRRLDAFVLFSSGAAIWGSGMQAGYAAANAFLDGLAAHRRSLGLAATSVSWGLWGGGGMGEGEGGERLERLGLRAMDPDLAIETLAAILDSAVATSGPPTATVADLDWGKFAPVFTLHRASALISDLPEVRAALAANGSAAGGEGADGAALPERLRGLSGLEQSRTLTDLVRAEAAAVLGHASTDEVEADRAFKDLGFDSLTSVELRNRLNAATGLALPATLVFDYPTPEALAEHVRAELIPDGGGSSSAASVLTEIERLQGSLSAVTAEFEQHEDVTRLLRALLSNWIETHGGPEPASSGIEFQSATPEEVFSFLDQQLGLPQSTPPTR